MTIRSAELARSITLAVLVLLPAACDDERRAPRAPGGSSQRSRAIEQDSDQSFTGQLGTLPSAASSEPMTEDAGTGGGSQGRDATRLHLLDVTGGTGASGSGGSAGFAGFGGSGGSADFTGFAGSAGTSGIGGSGGTSGFGGSSGSSGIAGFGGSAATGGS